MFRRQNSDAQSEVFYQSWHSVANPGTSSVDIMSSPDPLNEPAFNEQIPSSNTRRITRSQRAQKFLSLGASPRNQAYELDVGGARSSQRLVVSVERDSDDTQDATTQRRLFPTPSPSRTRGRRATTTTVPLKYSIDDESSDVLGSTNATPRPRNKSRTRVSNGTPIPRSILKKRKAPTPPANPSPRRPEAVADSIETDDSVSGVPRQRSPVPKRRKHDVEPSSDLGAEPVPVVPAARRGVRRRRQALAPEEVVGLPDAAPNPRARLDISASEDDLQRERAPETTPTQENRGMPTPTADSGDQVDIWMTTASQDGTPRASAQPIRSTSPNRLDRDTSEAGFEGDYGYLAPAASDFSSDNEAPPAGPLTVPNDTIAQGEDFSMIFMDSIPSLQASMHGAANTTTYSELGDDTNLIINNTLESLRQGDATDREDKGDDEEGEEEARNTDGRLEQEESALARSDDLPSMQATNSVSSLLEAEQTPEQEFELEIERALSQEMTDMINEPVEVNAEAGKEAQVEPDKASRPTILTARAPADTRALPGMEAEQAIAQQAPRSPFNFRSILFPQSPRKKTDSSPLRYRLLKQSTAQAEEVSRASVRPDESPNRTFGASVYNTQEQEKEQDQELEDESMMYEDSFSEIPEAVLAAAAPNGTTSARAIEEIDDEEMEGVMNEILARQTQQPPHDQATEAEPFDDHDAVDGAEEPVPTGLDEYNLGTYDEMAAAEGFAEGEDDSGSDDRGNQDDLEDQSASLTEASRLLIFDTAQPNTTKAPDSAQRRSSSRSLFHSPSKARLAPQPSPTSRSHLASVNQRSDTTTAPRGESSRGETPRKQTASPTRQPQSKPAQEPAPTQQLRELRPVFSPIRRAGRVLQSVTSDLPSPEAGQRHLGSPFRSSGSKESSLPGPREDEEEVGGLRSQSLSAQLSSKSPTARILTFEEKTAGQPSDSSPPHRSPVGEHERSAEAASENLYPVLPSLSPPQRRRPNVQEEMADAEPVAPSAAHLLQGQTLAAPVTSAEATAAASSLPAQRDVQASQQASPGRISLNSSLRHSIRSEDEMSWIANEGPISPNLRGDNTLREAVTSSTRPAGRSSFFDPGRSSVFDPGRSSVFDPGRSSVFDHAPFRSTPLQHELHAEGVANRESEQNERPRAEEQTSQPAVRDDDTDIWELEAEREAPKPRRQQPFGTSRRRGARTTQRGARTTTQRAGVQKPWMRKSVGAFRVPEPAPVPQPTVEQAEAPSRLEEDAEEYSLLARQRAAEEAQNLSDSAAQASKFDLSAFFSSPTAIPGMLAQKFLPGKSKPAERTTAASRKSASAPAPAPAPAPVTLSGRMFPQLPETEFALNAASRRNPFSTEDSQQASLQRPSSPGSVSPPTPEQLELPRASAYRNFTPRPRQASQVFAQQSSSRAVSAPTPPRMQLSHVDIRQWQQEARASGASNVSSQDSFVRPVLRPLPPRNASPAKSIMRSPLKPRTPGRVVEFTSSVLSPYEQELARRERRNSEAMQLENDAALLFDEDVGSEPPELVPRDDGFGGEYGGLRETSSDVSMTDAPPPVSHGYGSGSRSGSRSGPGSGTGSVALSTTVWTRQHWLLLDKLLRARYQRPFAVQYPHRTDRYLGKAVQSRGKEMQLEQWHLETVDAFRAEVGGWDEGILVKRLFALLLGQQTRQKTGYRSSRPRKTVMFH